MDLSNVSLMKLLPPNLAKDKNISMLCGAFDEELRRIIANIPGIAILPNLVLKTITDNLLLDLLAWQFHCDFYSIDFSIEKKQEIILKSLDWHTRKGTPSVVEELVTAALSKAEVEEWYEYGGLPYRFRIYTEEQLPDIETVNNLERAIKSVKNTRSWIDTITSIASSYADVLVGSIPDTDNSAHILAKEYEPYGYVEAVPGIHNQTHVLANEYEPYGQCAAAPGINTHTHILADEYEPYGYYTAVPEINNRIHILAKEYEPRGHYAAALEINNRIHVLAHEYEPCGYHVVPGITTRLDILSSEV